MSFKQSQSSWAALNPGCSETVSGESSSGVEMVKVTDAGFLMFVLYANMLELEQFASFSISVHSVEVVVVVSCSIGFT